MQVAGGQTVHIDQDSEVSEVITLTYGGGFTRLDNVKRNGRADYVIFIITSSDIG